jgi:hypothetical protein
MFPERPALAEGVERRDFGTYGVLGPPGNGSLLHLDSDEFSLLNLLDGTRTAKEIEEASGMPVEDLISDLWEEGFLEGSTEPPDKRVEVTLHGIEFSGVDRFVQWLNRHVGDFVFTAPVAIVIALVATAGVVAFVAQVVGGERLTVASTAPVLAVVVLRTLGLLSVGPHECGHALVTAHNKRRVGRFGVGFYWGALTFYVDASQALFLPRRTRMLQAAAGVITDMVLCGVASIIAWSVGGHATWILVLREFAVLGYLNVLSNAAPLLELDGYWFLADALDHPTLQRDSRQALREGVYHRPYSRGLAAYAVVSLVFGVVFVAIGLAAWWGLFGGLFLQLWHGGVGYKALAVYLILPFVPMVIHLSVQLLRFLRRQQEQPELAVSPQ